MFPPPAESSPVVCVCATDGLTGNAPEEAAARGVPGGLAGIALATSAAQNDDSSDEEDEYDEAEDEGDCDDAAAGEEEQAAHRRSEIIQRAKLLVRKAAILEKERTLSKRNEEEDGHAPPVEPGQAVPQVAAPGPRVKKPKGAKAAPLTAGRPKQESDFSRYRRQSAHNLMEDRKKEEIAAAERAANKVATTEKKQVRTASVSMYFQITVVRLCVQKQWQTYDLCVLAGLGFRRELEGYQLVGATWLRCLAPPQAPRKTWTSRVTSGGQRKRVNASSSSALFRCFTLLLIVCHLLTTQAWLL